VVATDVSPDAIEVARLNVERLHLAVELFMGDLFEPLPPDLDAGFDLIVANPPYVSEAEWALLPIDVRHEPRLALVAGPAGTEVLDRIAREAGPWLAPGGWVVCEIGETQAEAAARGFGERFARVSVRPDLTGRPRFVAASVPRLHG
jgi:release factor glutamine methyltransferase